jgi:two-component system, OmpR family, phosphate regulon response regulator PhoB
MSDRTLAVPPGLAPAASPVQVPVPPPSVRSTRGSDNGGAGAAPGRPVLVVEDEPGLAEVLAVHLQASGYQPIIAHDGLEALYALDRVTPHAVLLDLHLPQVSGFRLIQLLKQRPDVPRVPVIVLTALSFQEAEDAVRAGADDFVTKPFLPAEVVTRVDRLLERLA